MTKHSISRALWFKNGDSRTTLTQAELLDLEEPLIILGEAGMGKTTLLEWLSDAPGYAFCTARQLLYAAKAETLLGDAQVLVIDALDEVNAIRDGDAVGLVLRRLGEIGFPRFILSCRAADWRSATAVGIIIEQYRKKPLELHLIEFSDDDATTYLEQQIGVEAAKAIVRHFTSRGLQGFLGNPQTLYLVSKVAGQNDLPSTKDKLFERAIEVLRTEHNETKTIDEVPRQTVLDAAGTAFAIMILSGHDALSRTSSAERFEGDLPLAELGRFVDRIALGTALGTRLFRSRGPDRFGYWHRSIGEYLAARWLRSRADTARKRRRLLATFQRSGVVPSSLRGIHAWLARDPALAEAVITADPIGVIEYGDADEITPSQARALLNALSSLAAANPRFSESGRVSARGIAHPALLEDLRKLIKTADTPIRLRQFVLEAIRGSPAALQLSMDLRALMLDSNTAFIHRSTAGKALIELAVSEDWPASMKLLHASGDDLSIRLAIELMDKIGYERFDNKLIVDLVLSYTSHNHRTLGVLMGLEIHFPHNRLGDLLDELAIGVKAASRQVESYDAENDEEELKNFVYGLISRRVAFQEPSATQFWSWLEMFEAAPRYGYRSNEVLAAQIQEKHALRRAVQRFVLLDQPEGGAINSRAWAMRNRCSSLALIPYDVITLLESLDPSDIMDERWRELVQLTDHGNDNGTAVREAARPFARNDSGLLAWLESLAAPRDWEREQIRRNTAYAQQEAERHETHREFVRGQLDDIRAGRPESLINLAKGYLGLFNDVSKLGTTPHERMLGWLGHDLSEAALTGFESFLTAHRIHPSPDEIAHSMAQSRHWPTAYVIVAALAERYHNGYDFSDLDDERILAGLFELRRAGLARSTGIVDFEELIEDVVRERGLWPGAMRRYYEPQLEARYAETNLYSLMRSAQDAAVACDLAAEWLTRFADLPSRVEEQLMDRLLASGRYDTLRAIASTGFSSADDNRRRNWQAVGLLVVFDATSKRLDAQPIDAELLWHVRDRLPDGQWANAFPVRPAQLEWLISRFRKSWPAAALPEEGWSGDRNPWDASEQVARMIQRLGADAGQDATLALERLLAESTDGYTELIQSVVAEQKRVRVESLYAPLSLEAITAIVRDELPVSGADLQGFLIDELAVVQAKVRSDDVESWRGFYEGPTTPHREEWCRDHLILLLRQGSNGVTFTPEAHVGADKEVDIACSVGELRMPIEVKGQWHTELWTAADRQLAASYAQDWQADGYGIYLVLWFGKQVAKNKRIRSPGRGKTCPETPEQLAAALTSTSRAAQDGRIKILVLDLSRS